MTRRALEFLTDPQIVKAALSPTRRAILERLVAPASAGGLSTEMGMSRQRINYHLRALERAGFVEVVDERSRRGFVEQVFGLRADGFVVDPGIVGAGPPAEPEDRLTPEHLVRVATRIAGDVARMQARARGRIATFTIETEVSLMGPADVAHFQAALTQAVAGVVGEFDAPTAGKRYRVVVGGYPASTNRGRGQG